MKNTILIALILFFGCKEKKSQKPQNVNEEVQVILNTFQKGIVWVSKDDFKDMSAQILAERNHLTYKIREKIRKYTVTDSLLSMREFKYSGSDTVGKHLKKTLPLQFKALKDSLKGYEIIRKSLKIAELDSNYNGNLTFSRVIFNKERNRAKYYFEQYKMVSEHRGWGMGTYIYAKKVNGIWVFDKIDEVWIA